MLVLSRQRGEAIMIGEETEVTIVDIRGDKVRLGIKAPRTTSVHRKEVFDAIRKENQSSSELQPEDLPRHGPPVMRIANHDVQPPPGATHEQRASIDPFMRAAIEEAKKGLAEGGLPIGSVLVRDGKILAAGHNRRVQNGDPMAHAEIDCLSKAGRQKTYKDTVLYSTLMPCCLCSGAAVQFGVPKVIVGESVNFHGAPDLMRQHGVQVIDLHDTECIEMMKAFIRDHPDVWNEDIGQ